MANRFHGSPGHHPTGARPPSEGPGNLDGQMTDGRVAARVVNTEPGSMITAPSIGSMTPLRRGPHDRDHDPHSMDRRDIPAAFRKCA